MKIKMWSIWNIKDKMLFKMVYTKTDVLRRKVITYETKEMCEDFIDEFFGGYTPTRRLSIAEHYEPREVTIEVSDD